MYVLLTSENCAFKVGIQELNLQYIAHSLLLTHHLTRGEGSKLKGGGFYALFIEYTFHWSANKTILLMHFKFTYFCFVLTLYLFGIKTIKNRQSVYLFSEQKGAKTIPSGAAHTYLAYIR